MTEINSEQELLQRLSVLPREIKPENDVWSKIEGRISHHTHVPDVPENFQRSGDNEQGVPRFRVWPVAIAASVLLAVTAGIFLRSQVHMPARVVPVAGSASVTGITQGRVIPGGSMTVTEIEYQAAFREFLALSASPDQLDESALLWVEQVWGDLRKLETELLVALGAEPENRLLNTQMAALRAHQLNLLQEVAAMDRYSRRNTI